MRTRRLLALLLAVLMTVSLFPLQTFAADGEDVNPETEPAEPVEPETGEPEILLSGDCSGSASNNDIPDVHYCLTDDGVMRISGTGAMKAYAPSGTNQVPWANLRAQITSVVVEEGVTYIGSYSFQNCTALQTVQLPSTLTSVANYVFSGCTSLSGALTLPDSIAWIGDYAFNGCWLLTGDLVIPEGCTSVGKYAFANCSGFTSLSLPSTLTTIGEYAFRGCTGLKGVVSIPSGVTVLQSYTFSGDTGLTGIVLNVGEKKTMYQRVFYGCTGVRELALTGDKLIGGTAFLSDLSGLKTVSVPSAFYSDYAEFAANNLPAGAVMRAADSENDLLIIDNVLVAYQGDDAEVQIPEGVTAIGHSAFRNHTEVTKVMLPDTLQLIGAYAFCGCSALSQINFPTGLKSIGAYAFYNCVGLTGDLVLPAGMTELGEYAFSGCTGFSGQLTLSAGLTSIPSYAFQNCSGFEGVLLIPERVTSIGSASFAGLNQITTIDCGSALTNLASNSFQNCNAVDSITFRGATVPSGLSLSKMTALESVYAPRGSFEAYCNALYGKIPAAARVYCLGFDGDLLIEDDVLLGYYGESESLEIPKGITVLCSGAFCNCTNLVSVSIPEGVTSIGSYAFYKCTSLEEAALPDSLQILGSYAFYNCSKLTGTAVIPDGNTVAPEYVYYNCSSITALAPLPEQLSKVEQYAFYGCSSMTGTLSFSEGFQSVGYAAFRGCSSLTGELILPEGVSLVRECFEGCSGFTGELVVPGSVKTIDLDVFCGCSGFTSLVLSEGVGRAFDRSLSGLGDLDSITFASSIYSLGNSTGSSCFGNTNPKSVTIMKTSIDSALFKKFTNFSSLKTVYVPAESYDYYINTHRASLADSVKLLPIGDTGEFQIKDGVLLSYLGEGGDVVIPDTVTTIGNAVFLDNTDITSVTMPASVSSIGAKAFSGCTGLAQVSFSESIEEIGDNAFYQCTALTELTLPGMLQTIGEKAFQGCSGLTEVTIPSSVTSLGSYAFADCTQLKTVCLPETLKKIPNYSFSNCSALENILLPAGVEEIGAGAFYSCTSLQEMALPEGLTDIGNSSFALCTGLTALTLPDSLIRIENNAFYKCTGLTGNLSFPDNVTYIGSQAFAYCTGLEELEFGVSVETMGTSWDTYTDYSSFAYCTGLKKATFYGQIPPAMKASFLHRFAQIYVPADAYEAYGAAYTGSLGTNGRLLCLDDDAVFVIRDGVLVAYQGTESTVVVPDGVTRIGSGAFANCKMLVSVTLPQSLESVGTYAFFRCTKLTSVSLPDSVTELGDHAFYSCSELASVHLANGIKTIGTNTFYNCSALQQLILPSRLETIKAYAFYGCDGLNSLVLPDTLKTLEQNAFTSSGITGSMAIPDGITELQDNVLPAGLKQIRFGTGLTKLSSKSISASAQEVTFTSAPPEGVYDALKSHNSLSMVEVPAQYYSQYLALLDSLTTSGGIPVRLLAYGNDEDFMIEDGVLVGYFGSATDVTIPDGVTNIGTSAFRGCTSMTSVALPETVTSIGNNAFQGCTSLERVNFPSGLEAIGSNAFRECTALGPSLNLPGVLRTIGSYAFYNCRALTAVSLPDTVESIGSYAFSGCPGLSGDLALPSSLESLGAYAFNGCTSLSGTLTLQEGLGTLNSCAFYNTRFTGALLIPDSVTTINSNAFYGNTGITSVTFGSGLKTLSTAFPGCTGVTELTFTGTTVPTLSGNPFSDLTNLQTIYVPAEAYDDYVALLTGKIGSNVQISTDMTRIAVSNLRAERVGSASANLKWDAHISGEVERYTVLRDGQVISETDGLTFRDSGLTPGQTYTYEVYGVLPDGGQTGVSKPLTVTPQIMTITDIRTGNAQNKVGLEHGNIMAYVSDPVGASVTAQGMLYYLDGETPVEIGPMPRSAELSTTSTAVFLAVWDIENVPDGDYTVRFVLTDEDGTTVQRDQVVTVDHTRPAQIAGLAATDDVTAIHLTWSIAAELDTTAYRIYRRVQGSEEFRLIGQVNDRATLSYVDRNVRNDRVYEYYVTGVSSFGQESLPSLVVTATLIADTTAPTVTNLTPASMNWLTGSVTIAMKAEDNVNVARTELLYSADGGETWEAFAFARAAMLTGTLNTADLPDGEIRVRALAWDAAGNESDPLTYVYRIDNTGPEAVTGLAAEATSVTITLHWNDVADNDISYFRVERQAENGSFVTQQSSIKTLGLNIQGMTPDTEYTYRVVGYDVRGNRGAESEPITVRTAADTTAPVITRILPGSGYYNAEIPLSITAEDDYNVVSFTVQVSTDGLTWSDVDTVSFDGVSARRTLTYALSLADLPEGVVSVRAVAVDSAGNHSDSSAAAPLTQHMVDRTPPAAPAEVMASGGVGYVEVSWVQGAESDLGKYSVYRADAEDGEYVRMASGIASVNWFDRTPEENVTYYYKVSVNDLAGNESALSEAVSARAENDTELPKIVSIYPEQGSALGAGYRTVSVLATDNRALDSIRMEYSLDGSVWSNVGELKNINAYSKRYAPQLPLSALVDGKTVYIRVTVTDLSGNTATGSAQYTADMTAPTVKTASAAFDPAEDLVTVTWTGAQETDLAGHRVYRSVVGASGEKLIAQRKAVEGQTEYSCKDVDISAQAVQYVYRVEAMDSCGNTASLDADVLTIPDRTAPKAVLECDPVQEVGVEYLFDATKSRDNGSIVSYQMDLGDGTVTDQPKLVHVYQETGEYTVTLTVTDNEGNVGTLTQSITVRERNLMGEAQILVLDDAGKPVPNAPVYFDLGEETQVIRNTDKNGAVLFMSGVGRHTVGCVIANNEWLPAKKDVIISANARAVVSITLVRQPIIEGQFEVKRMTFDEIVAQGIDISAPENQHMLQVRSTLTYGSQTISTTFVYNELTQQTLAPPFVITTEDGEKRTLTPHVIPIPGEQVNEATFTSEAAVAYLDIPASASFLKEFFDVKLHIINNAASAFTMTDNTVTLNVPDGLSIVPSEATESNSVVVIPEIPGQTTSTISWILRGDKAGEYPLSADYSGMLSEFNQTISARFEAEEPIKVYGLDAVKLIAEVNTSLDYDALYFGLSMQNVDEAEIYLPEIGVMEDTISSQLNEDAANAVTVRALNTVVTNASGARRELRAGAAVPSLRPGETLTRQYAAYGAVGENHVLRLRDIIAQIADSYGMPFEIIERKADLFSMDHAAEKLSSIAADENRSGEYNYILNHANFFYVQQALTNDEALVNAVSTGQYQSAELHLDYVLSRSEQTSYAVQELVLRLLRDEALAQTAETRVAGHWLGAADALSGSLRENTAQTLSEADLTILNAWLADDADRGNRSEALRRDGLESFAGRTLRTLEADGMSAEGIATIRAWLESTAAADALSAALCKGSPLLTAAVERRADLSFDVASCDAILMMEAVCSEAQALPALLSAGVTENSKQAKALDDMADALKAGTETLTARLMTALDACSDASEIAAAVSAVCGDTTVDTLIAASFDELAVPDKIFVRTMLSAETALSFALTKAISNNGGLAPKDDAAALDTLKALKYLISLRIYSEKTFADQADADESVQQPTVNHINAARNSSYETVNDYARDVSADLLRYRDDLFASGRTDPNRPEAPVVTVNYLAGTTAERFSSDYEYSFDGTHWTRCSGAAIDLAPGAVAKHLRVRLRETASAFAGNEANVVVAAKPRLQGDIQLVISDEACTVSGLAEGVYAYAFTDDREQVPSFTGRFSVDASGSVTLSYPQPFLYLALERQADETHFASLVRFAMQDNWLRDNENMFIIGIPAGTSYEDALDHYARLGLEALITDASGNPTTSVGTGSLVDLNGEVYEAVVRGDVSGDAAVDQADLDLMLDHINYQQELSGAYLRAARATDEPTVGIFDLYAVLDDSQTPADGN